MKNSNSTEKKNTKTKSKTYSLFLKIGLGQEELFPYFRGIETPLEVCHLYNKTRCTFIYLIVLKK